MSKKDNKVKGFVKKNKSMINLILLIAICFAAARLITLYVFPSQLVVGSSMMPTLENGDKAVSDGVFFRVFGIDRFDIVVFERGDELLVKRVIGLPGETIHYEDGVLTINDEVIEEDFISDYVSLHTTDVNGIVDETLEENEYFVMGDNRVGNNSFDSRNFGAITYDKIESVGLLRFATCDSVSDGSCVGIHLEWPNKVD